MEGETIFFKQFNANYRIKFWTEDKVFGLTCIERLSRTSSMNQRSSMVTCINSVLPYLDKHMRDFIRKFLMPSAAARCLVIFVTISIPSIESVAERRVDIYEYAQMVAVVADRAAKDQANMDDITVSARAFAEGKSVVIENVLAIRRDVTESELSAWRAGTRSEIYPQACRALESDLFWNQGFHMRYRYLNREGHVLDDFLVNKPACDGYFAQ
jgi:hypothetical protein